MRGAEEVQADEAVRVRKTLEDQLRIEIGRVGGEDGPVRAYLGEFRENGALDVEILEHSLDHQIAIGKIVIVGGSRKVSQARVMLLLAKASFCERSPIDLFNVGAAPCDSLVVALDHADGQARIAHGGCDTGAHGAAADDTDAGDRARFDALDFSWPRRCT